MKNGKTSKMEKVSKHEKVKNTKTGKVIKCKIRKSVKK